MKKLLFCLLVMPLTFALGEASSGASSSANSKYKNLKEELTSFVADLEVKTYVLSIKSANTYKVESMSVRCLTGTAQVDLEINDVVVTGCNNTAVSSSTATAVCTAANLLSKDQKLELKVDSEVSCVDFSLGLLMRRVS